MNLKSFGLWMSVMSIIGCIFNIYKSPICWPIWEANAFGFSYYFLFYKKDYGAAIVWIFYIFFDAFGWYVWTR
jgi:hypothetical protein